MGISYIINDGLNGGSIIFYCLLTTQVAFFRIVICNFADENQ